MFASTFDWYLDVSVNLSLPLMVISIYLIVTNAPLSEGLPFPMYGFIGKLALLFLLLGGIPKLLSFLAFAVGSWYLSSKMTDVAVKPYDKKAGTDAEGLAGAADSTDVEMT